MPSSPGFGSAFLQQYPFVVWDTSEQIRSSPYVSNIVEGTIHDAEATKDGTASTLETMKRTSVMQAASRTLSHRR